MKALRSLPVAIWLLAIVASLAIIANTRFTADMSAFLPSNPTPQQALLVEQLREGPLSRTLLIGIEGADAAARSQLSQSLADAMRDSGHFAIVSNGSAATTARDRELLFNNRYLLSPAVDAEHFSTDGLHRAIDDSVALLASPVGMLLKQLLPRDPTGEMVALLSAVGGGNSTPDSQFGTWASRDGERALLMAQTLAAGSDTDAQQAAIGAIQNAFADLAAKAGHADAQVLLSGAPVFSVEARAAIKQEIHRLALISAAGILTLLWFAYRSVRAIAFGLLPVLSGALAGIAAVSLGFGSVHGITIGFGTTLIGEAVDYTIYYFVQSNGSRSDQAERWIERFWPTIRLGVLTSICGFAAMLGSGFPGLAQLGLYSIVGLVTAAAMTRYVLPVICPQGTGRRQSGLGWLSRHATRGLLACTRLGADRRGLWLVTVLVIGAASVLWHQKDSLWNHSLSGLSPVPPAAQALDQKLRGDIGAPDLRYLVVIRRSGPDADSAREATLAAAERAGTVLDTLVAQGRLAGYNSAARALPSQATQQQRRDALPDRATLQQRLNQATADLPLSAARLSGFVDDVEAARTRPLLDRRQLADSSLGLLVDSLLMPRQNPAAGGAEWLALMPLRAIDGQEIDPAQIQAALARMDVGDAVCLDLANESTDVYSNYLDEVILLSSAGAVAIALLLLIALRSPRRVVHVMAPLLAAILIVLAGLALAGIKLTLLHLIGLLLIVAVGSNYALFFDRPASDGHDELDNDTLSSLLLANLATLIGFGTLALAKVPVLQAIGITVGPGAVLALLFAALLARA